MVKRYTNYRGNKRLLKRLLKLLKEVLGERLLGLVLFGSIARGEAGKESDVDLLVLFSGDRIAVQKEFVKAVLRLRRTEEHGEMAREGYLRVPFLVFMDVARLKTHPWILLDIVDHGIILLDKGKILRTEFKQIKRRLRELGSRKVLLKDGTWYWDLKPDWQPGEVINL